MIENYHFGSITIDGQKYDDDICITATGQVKERITENDHVFSQQEIAGLLAEKPEVIVLGTGQPGLARLSQEAEQEIVNQGVKFIIKPTEEAIKEYNQLTKGGRRVAALLHLTC